MASQPQFAGGAPALPLTLIAQAIPKLSRHDLEALTERLIDHLDQQDGEPDYEDSTDLEDDFALSPQALGYVTGPGCPVGDPGGQCDEDEVNTDLDRLRSIYPDCILSDEDC